MAANAQTAIDNDFEDGTLGGWTASIPEGHTGGYSVVTYASQTALKVTNVGENTLGGTNVMLSKTGAKNAVKADSDNWLTSPEFTVGTENIFSFRLAANCSYSPTKEEAEKMKMDVVVIEGETQTVVATIAPENYFTWKQYSIDLSAYAGKTVKVAFHDYGTAGSGAVAEMKFIDNIKLTAEAASDFSVAAATALHGQAEYTAPYTMTVANYGVAKGSFVANYQIGEGEVVSETVTSDIAAGQTVDYTFQTAPSFAEGTTNEFKAWVSAADDAMVSNDSVAVATITACAKQALPYSVCNVLDDEDTENDDLVETEFAQATGSSNAKWAYDPIKYNAWIFSQKKNDAKYIGVGYLYTTKAYSLPAGKVTLKTTGTATLTDNYYEVYIAKYGDKGMADYGTKVGQSEVLRNVVETETIDETTVELDIPEAGDYVIGIRPMCSQKNAQVTIIGLSLEAPKAELTLAGVTPAEGSELAQMPDVINVTYSSNEGVGYGIWRVVDQNPDDEMNAVIYTGQLKPDGENWRGKVFYAEYMKLYSGHTYQLEIYPFASEDDYNYQAQTGEFGAGALAKFVVNWTGTTAAYVYSDATLVSLNPENGSVIETGDIVATFSAPVTVVSAEMNNGIMGDNTPCTLTPNADNTVWTITIPKNILDASTGSLNMNVKVKGADGKVVKGNASEEDDSYFEWTFNCYNGAPELNVVPASGSTVAAISELEISAASVINISYLTIEKITVMKDGVAVATFDNVTIADDNSKATATLAQAISEAGTYEVVIPAMYFMIGEEFSSILNKKQTITLIVDPATGIRSINADNSNDLYNIAGQRVSGNVKGIVISNGKKHLKK